ncbi:MAG TPA: molybdopterin-binding protein [Steroidobacteraceae bacterium]|nr:molybdopterin-binding protein [Steroidobacteraceae bacterium]
MRLSIRNSLKGKIAAISRGPVSTEVIIHVAPGIDLVSVITTESAERLNLKEGQQAYALIKSSSISIGVD